MKGTNYELCEKCEQAMAEVSLTVEEMKEQQFEFDFGTAIIFLKEGDKLARKKWGKDGAFIYLVRGSIIPKSNLRNEAAAKIADSSTETVQIHSHVDQKLSDGSIVIGWTPSQEDMLADDWYLA